MHKFEPCRGNALPVCAGCNCSIHSKFLLRLSQAAGGSGDGEIINFHVTCLRCSQCGFQLDESNEKCWANCHFGVLCQSCYKVKTHCAKCKLRMPRGSLVQRIFNCVFHLDCFTCSRCNWRLQFGEYIAFAEGEVFCAWHLRPLPPLPPAQPHLKLSETSWSDPGQTNADSIEYPFTDELFDGDDKSSQSKPMSMGRVSSASENTLEETIAFDESGKIPTPTLRSFIHQGHGHQGRQQQPTSSRTACTSSDRQQRSKRIRTSFTPQQIAVLQASFKTVSNPDGQELERIAQATCLTKRVTQVWFQNARARKKKNVQNSMLHQQSSPQPRSLVCSNDGQEEVVEAFISNPLPSDTGNRAKDDSQLLIASPLSPHLTSTLKSTTMASYFTKDDCL